MDSSITSLETYFKHQSSCFKEKHRSLVRDAPEKENRAAKRSSELASISNKSTSHDRKLPVKHHKKKAAYSRNTLNPKKYKRQSKLGTSTSFEQSVQNMIPGKVPGEKVSINLEESASGSEYIPSADDISSDDSKSLPAINRSGNSVCKPAYKRRKKPSFGSWKRVKSRRNQQNVSKKCLKSTSWDSDDSDWDYSDKEVEKERKGKELDDGNADDYTKRIQAWTRSDTWDDNSFEDIESLKVPHRIWNKLYLYQKDGVKWMWQLHLERCGGILGDEMGLGKTIQVIAFLSSLAFSKHIHRESKFKGLGPCIIVCPATMLHQWTKEFHQWWPIFRVGILHESGSYKGTRESLIRNLNRENGILLVTYSGIVQYFDLLIQRDWHYLILDEGHKIRNPEAQATLSVKQFRTPHRIILSGSPIQNNLNELWSLMDFVFPGKLGTLDVFMEQFSIPIVHGGYSNATPVQVATAFKCATVLRDTIAPYMLRRMKSELKEHLKLPPKNEQVLFCRLTKEQRELYQSYIDSGEVDRILDGRLQIFLGLIKLRKLCNHPDLFTGRVVTNEDQFEPLKDKEDQSSTAENELEKQEAGHYGYWKRSGKMIVVESLLKIWNKQKHKVLIFSQSRQMLCILEDFVQRRGYTYSRLDGGTSVSSRQVLIDKFNKDDTFVFLLTTKVGGLGVNLTGASRVIIFDPDWNPSTDTQARERAWRIGQDKLVTIYRLLTAGTIEEKIYHRQIFKQFLTNKVLKDPRQRRFFKTNDLHELFTLREGNKEKTESAAIFAGTGSEIKLKRKRYKKNGKATSSGKSVESNNPRECDENLGKLSAAKKHSETHAEVEQHDDAANIQPKIEPEDEVESIAETSCDAKLREDVAEMLGNQSSVKAEMEDGELDDDIEAAFQETGCEMKSVVDVAMEQVNKLISSKSRSAAGKVRQLKKRKDRDCDMNDGSESDRHKKSKKKKKGVEFEGERISYLVKKEEYKRSKEESSDESSKIEENQKQDDYVLERLFSKSGVYSALRHDCIENTGDPDYQLVEGEAERVAKEAIAKLKKSRDLIKTAWNSNASENGCPPKQIKSKLRFGRKKNSSMALHTRIASSAVTETTLASTAGSKGGRKKSKDKKFGLLTEDPSPVFNGASSSHQRCSTALSSSDILSAINRRNRLLSTDAEEIETFDENSSDGHSLSKHVKLVAEIRNFIVFGAFKFGEATTDELLKEFSDKVPSDGSVPLFRAILQQMCSFERSSDGQGVWRILNDVT